MTCQSRVHVGNYGDDLRGRSSGTLGALGHHRPFGVFDFARPTGDFPSKCIEGLPLNSGAFNGCVECRRISPGAELVGVGKVAVRD
jgi:hypothetical protein